MGLAQEKFIQEFCEAWGDGTSQTKPNVEKILSMMAEDAEWQLWVPGGPIVSGRGALREEIHRQMRFATNNKCNIVNVLSSDRMVMQERSDTAIILGKPCPHQMVAIYELDENGLIKRWREYLDMVCSALQVATYMWTRTAKRSATKMYSPKWQQLDCIMRPAGWAQSSSTTW